MTALGRIKIWILPGYVDPIVMLLPAVLIRHKASRKNSIFRYRVSKWVYNLSRMNHSALSSYRSEDANHLSVEKVHFSTNIWETYPQREAQHSTTRRLRAYVPIMNSNDRISKFSQRLGVNIWNTGLCFSTRTTVNTNFLFTGASLFIGAKAILPYFQPLKSFRYIKGILTDL